MSIQLFVQRYIFCFTLCFSVLSGNTNAQDNENKTRAIQLYPVQPERVINEDPLLVNGRIYRIYRQDARENPFLFTDQWFPATIYVMEHEFLQRKVKYDIYQDVLVLQIENATANYNQITLNKSFVDSFIMASNRKFLNANHINSPELKVSYVELIADGRVQMIRTYKKDFVEIYNNFTPNGSYGDARTKEFLVSENNLTDISKKRLFVRSFGDNKREIRRFMRKNDIKYRKASKDELVKLMNYCNALVEK